MTPFNIQKQVQQLINSGNVTTGPNGEIPTAQLVLNALDAHGQPVVNSAGGATPTLVATPVGNIQSHHHHQHHLHSSLSQTNLVQAQPVTTTPIQQQQQQQPQQQQQKQSINYTCTYCTFGADKLKKIGDHLRQNHPHRDRTCMDNLKQQLIRLPNDANPVTASVGFAIMWPKP